MTVPASRTSRLLLGAGLLLTLYACGVSAYHALYRDRLFPGVVLDGVPVGSLTKSEFLAQTEAGRLALLQRQRPLTLQRNGSTDRLRLETPFLLVDGEHLWRLAFAAGRDPRDAEFYAPFSLRWWQPSLRLTDAITADQAVLRARLTETLTNAGWIQAAQPARLRYDSDETAPDTLQVSLEPAKEERRVDLDTLTNHVMHAIRGGSNEAVEVSPISGQPPSPTTEALAALLPQAQRWASGPLTLRSGGTDTVLSAATLAAWTEPRPGASSSTSEFALDLNRERVEAALGTLPSTRLQEPRNGTLTVNEQNQITELVLPTRGQRLNLDATLAGLRRALDASGQNRVATTTIDTVYATFEGPDAERLGIKDLLGQGASNFSGSPSNRRKNIALGGNKVHQTLVAPGTDFSLLNALGEIDGAHGWLPELVIKGTQTVPEYGGGLCQIGTTVFRSALNAGLPITERRNHSYRVRYYEPAGTDATIYDPAPDFKFRNDLPGWLLITQEKEADDIRFLIWGTKDGRVASSSTPVVTNIIQPPPKKIIETTDLPPGTTKCTETAHAGATASFDYEVTYPNGEVKKTTFKSVYRPWQAVCLVGVAQLSTPAPQSQGVDASGLNSAG